MLAQMKKGLFTFLAATVLSTAGGSGLYAAQPQGEQRAAQITSLRPDGKSPAETAGLSVRDKILAVDGTPVTDRPALLQKLDNLGGAAVLRVLFAKNGEVRDVRVLPDPHLGIHFKIVKMTAK
jgi:predicted metalloprotease with PDZ domain